MTTESGHPSNNNSSYATVFSIEGQGLKLDAVDNVAPFIEILNAMENLKEMRLSGNTFGVDAATELAEALKSKWNLEYCYFSDMFTGRLKTEIPHALKAIGDALVDKSIKLLDLSDNAFGPTGAEPLRNFLSNNHSFEVLRLNNNGLGVAGGTILAECLLSNASVSDQLKKSNLKVFIAGRNRLENGSMEALSKAFHAHGTLTHISMPQNGIRPEGIVTLLSSLSSCPDLKVLDLQDNTFTLVGSKALAQALPGWKKLNKLHVGDCLLGREGAKVLFTAMLEHKVETLEELHLGFNEIDEGSMRILLKWLEKYGGQVKLLELNGNCFDPEGELVERLKEVLIEHGHPDALDELDEMEWDESDEEEDHGEGEADAERKDEEVEALADILSKKLEV